MEVTGPVWQAIVAILAGAVVAPLLFVPFVALSYRRRGTLSLGRIATWMAALIYGWAIWTYTLLPFPDPADVTCAGAILDPLAFLDDLSEAIGEAGGRPTAAFAEPVATQLLLNVVLFVPLGFLVRALGNRGAIFAGVAGLVLSLLVETTQLTGVWGLYPCAYRFFDVMDLFTNTVGALCGSVLGLVVPRVWRDWSTVPSPTRPCPVTRWRRLLAMIVDGVGLLLTIGTVTLAVRAVRLYLLDDELGGAMPAAVAGTVVAIVVWTSVTLATGRTVGDLAVQLRYHGGPIPAPLARLLRLVGGIGGYAALTAWPGRGEELGSLYLAVAVVSVLLTEHGRGLPGLLSGQALHDARATPTPPRR